MYLSTSLKNLHNIHMNNIFHLPPSIVHIELPPSHMQSPLHHAAPFPCGHSSHVAAEWSPHETEEPEEPMMKYILFYN